MHANRIKSEIRWYEKSLKGSLEILPKYESLGLTDCVEHSKKNIARCERWLAVYRQALTIKPAERLNFLVSNKGE